MKIFPTLVSQAKGSGGGGGGVTNPLTANLNGGGHNIFNVSIFDNQSTPTVILDGINRVLKSVGGTNLIDLTGNGGGGSIPSPTPYITFDTGEQNIALFRPIADHNYNISVETNLRNLYDASQIGVITWLNQGYDGGFNISTGYNSGAGADETYISKGYFNLNYASGVGAGVQCLGTGGGGEVMGISAPSLDGSNFYNLNYGSLSGAPWDTGGNAQVGPINLNGNELLTNGANIDFNNGQILQVSLVNYSPPNSSYWSGNPSYFNDAIDRIAAVVSLGGASPIP